MINGWSRSMVGAVALGFLFLGFAAIGCGEQSASVDRADAGVADRDSVLVVATIGMVGDVAAGVGGEHVSVETFVSPGVDPHIYAPTRTDVEAMLDADIVLANGLNLEGKMGETFDRARESGRVVIQIAEAIDASKTLESDEEPGERDPHLWMDPSLWSETVDTVADALIAIDPANDTSYRANADAYRSTLAELDAYAERVLSTVDESSRVLVTAHDAFNYFGARYGFEVVGLQGISTESEPGVRDVERLVDLLVERNVPAVFVESTVSARGVEALIEGARARGHTVTVGGELFSDAMGDAGTYEGTYVGMIDHNVTTIARALGGEAPEGGMQGLLANAPESEGE